MNKEFDEKVTVNEADATKNVDTSAADGNQDAAVGAEVVDTVDATQSANPSVDNDPVAEKLSGFGISNAAIHYIEDELGVSDPSDLTLLDENDLVKAGVKPVQARKLLAELKKGNPTAEITDAGKQAIQSQLETLLPAIPSDESWLNALKTGGVLKVDKSSYIAAMRAALADRAGLYKVPTALADAMEKYADETEEQVDPTYYALRQSLTRRRYGDIFAAIPGLDGSYITDARRKEFLKRIQDTLWPELAASYRALDNWYQTWRASFADPSMLIAAISGGLGGHAGVNMVAPPDTSPLHDVGDALVDAVNRIFRGTGIQVAAAMAYDANLIRKTLEDPRLPSMVGVKNRDLMLKKIGINVSSNYVRLEQNLVKYLLSFVNHDTVTSDVETNYFVALWQLGTQIDWNSLGLNGVSGASGVSGLGGGALL